MFIAVFLVQNNGGIEKIRAKNHLGAEMLRFFISTQLIHNPNAKNRLLLTFNDLSQTCAKVSLKCSTKMA